MTPVILFEDKSVVVTVKPVGTESQASKSGNDMLSLLSEHTGCTVYPVHRLDRDTVGVMVYAKTEKAAASLSGAFANGKTDKRYLAVTLGSPTEKEGTYKDLLYHDAKRNKTFVVDKKRGGVKEASLSYSVIKALDREKSPTLVSIKLHTGRTHQIRVQFASRKTPLYGDARYGGKVEGTNKMALACVSLSFPHPESGESMTFTHSPEGGIWDSFSEVL